MSSATSPASIPHQPAGAAPADRRPAGVGSGVAGSGVAGSAVAGSGVAGSSVVGSGVVGSVGAGSGGAGERGGAAGVVDVGLGPARGAGPFPAELAAQPVQGPPVPPEWYHYYAQQQPPDRLGRFVHRLNTRSPVWVAPLAMLACMGGAIGYTLVSHPEQADAGAAPTCLLKLTTGFCCPGCGGTRAAWYLLHGNIPAAARHHAIFTFAVPFLVYMYVAWAGRRLFNWKLPQLTVGPRVMVGFLVVWGVWSVLRNLPWAPFTAFYV